jgi:hypothetical protein
MLWLPWGGVQWVRIEVGHRGQLCATVGAECVSPVGQRWFRG